MRKLFLLLFICLLDLSLTAMQPTKEFENNMPSLASSYFVKCGAVLKEFENYLKKYKRGACCTFEDSESISLQEEILIRARKLAEEDPEEFCTTEFCVLYEMIINEIFEDEEIKKALEEVKRLKKEHISIQNDNSRLRAQLRQCQSEPKELDELDLNATQDNFSDESY